MSSTAVRALGLELKSLKDEPLEGFRVRLLNDDNLFDWEVAIFGPPGTIYEGGYFKARMHFPADYPYNPPSMRFEKATLFHPNVYENGEVCISILHPPVDDPQSGELPCERWNPTQSVRTILLSVVSLLNEPNTSSPANVDASVMYRKWKDSKGVEKEYENIVKRQVAQGRQEAEKDGVVVPTTLEDYIVKPGPSQTKSSVDMDYYDDDYDMDLDDDDASITPNDSQAVTSEASQSEEGHSQPQLSTNPPDTTIPTVVVADSTGKGGEKFDEQSVNEPHPNQLPSDIKPSNDGVSSRYKFNKITCEFVDPPQN